MLFMEIYFVGMMNVDVDGWFPLWEGRTDGRRPV